MTASSPSRSQARTRSQSSTNSRDGEPREELEVFAAFCANVLTTEDGSSLDLYPEQKLMLRDYFEGVRETLILIPKKCGKSTLLAALGLFHLCTTPDAECIIVAASREQAGIMLTQASGFIRRSEALKARLRVKQREIVHKDLAGRIRVLASDVDTVDGVIPTLALVDELHRHKTEELYGILRDGLGPRDGRMVTISTAGDSMETPLGRLRRAAYNRAGMVRDGAYRYVRGPGNVLHEWALDPEQDFDDIALVKTANPAPWQTLQELSARHDSDSMRDWQWKRFACGLWVGGEDAAISDREWRDNAQPGLTIPSKAVPTIGIDIGRRVDCTGIVAAWREGPDDPIMLEPLAILYPPGDGTSIPEDDIWAPLAAAAERWPTATFVADPNLGGDIFIERLERAYPNILAAEFEQGPLALARMAGQFTEQVAAGRLRHPDDPVLNAHVLAATSQSVGEKWRFVKQRKKKLPIDALIAAGIAVSTLIGNEAPKKKHAHAQW